MTGALVAPQSLYLDKLISRFKVPSPFKSFHGFLIDAPSSSIFRLKHGGKRLNNGGGGASMDPSLPSFRVFLQEDLEVFPRPERISNPGSMALGLHEVKVDMPALPLPRRHPGQKPRRPLSF